MTSPRVGITFGDPGGIGPEIIVKAFTGEHDLPEARYILFGSSSLLKKEEAALSVHLPLSSEGGGGRFVSGSLTLNDLAVPAKRGKRGSPSAANGLASFLYFKTAVAEARRGNLQALVTAPISKASWALAGLEWKGHTDYLGQFYPEVIMTFWSEKLRVALLSHHLPLQEALREVNRERLENFFLALQRSLKKVRSEDFDFRVAGLNPHAGEGGLLGREELEVIVPAVEAARRQGLKVSGPYPPDVVFRAALGLKNVIVIALYHDQGLIPFKLEAFDSGVNVSLGLPFARTSPDHGTAFDIAGKNAASPRSLVEAIKLAVELSPGSA
jgi:4-hydroxythreonine-4-phosphate dehydrogenase